MRWAWKCSAHEHELPHPPPYRQIPRCTHDGHCCLLRCDPLGERFTVAAELQGHCPHPDAADSEAFRFPRFERRGSLASSARTDDDGANAHDDRASHAHPDCNRANDHGACANAYNHGANTDDDRASTIDTSYRLPHWGPLISGAFRLRPTHRIGAPWFHPEFGR